MSRVLLVCPERLGHHNPAGIGIRFLEFARALLADGHQVTMLSADGGAIPGCECQKATAESIARHSRSSDVAVVQGHMANELSAHGANIPVVVDLYDPFIIENLHYHAELGDRVFANDHATLMRSLQLGDFFLCASPDQRLFYLGALLAAGRLNPQAFERDPDLKDLLSVVPFGVPPPIPPAARHSANPRILFGGIYDWYEPRIAIDAIALARESFPGMTLTFTQHPNADVTPQSKFAEAMRYVRNQGYSSFVLQEPWTPYAGRADFYRRFAAVLLTFNPSVETDLAMRTRIFDSLWAGLPVITSSAPGTDSLLRQFDAGVVVDGDDPGRYADALVQLLRDEPQYLAKVRGTQRYVNEHQWPKLLAPLLAFCRNPRIDETRPPAASFPGQRRSLLGDLKKALRG